MTPDAVRADTEGTPPGVRAPHAGAFDQTHTHNQTPVLAATSPRDELAAALSELRDRGVNNPDEFRSLGANTVKDTVRWFDAQNGRVTAGVLVVELRGGGKPGWRPAARAGQSATEYAAGIAAWLNEHFPDLTERSGNPHPAAVVQVIHLHHELGKGRVLPREHATRIRAAVRAFNEKWDYSPTEGGSS